MFRIRNARKNSSFRNLNVLSSRLQHRLERLDERVVPAIMTWANPNVGGEYTNPANWLGGQVPGINDEADIGTGNVFPTITVSGPAGVGYLNAGGYKFEILAGGSFTVGRLGGQPNSGGMHAMTVDNGSTLDFLPQSYFYGPISNHGQVDLYNTVTVADPFVNQADGITRAVGQSAAGSNITISNPTNYGTLDLTSEGAISDVTLNTGNALINSAGGTVRSLTGAGGARTIDSEVDNSGLISVEKTLTIGSLGKLDTTNGNVAIGIGQRIIANYVTIGTNSLGYGTGDLQVNSTLTLAQDVTFQPNTIPVLMQTGSSIVGPGALTLQDQLELDGVNSGGGGHGVYAALIIDGGALLVEGGAPVVSGPLTVKSTAGSSIVLDGDATYGDSTLTVNNSFSNNGSIYLTSHGGAFNDLLVQPGAATMTNAGAIYSQPGSGGTRTIDTPITNTGAIHVQQSLSVIGSLNSVGATLDISATQTLSNTGSSTTTIDGLTTLTGSGTLAVSNLNIISDVNIPASGLILDLSSTVNGPGTLTDASVILLGSNTGFNTALNLQGTLNVRGFANSIGGQVTTTSGAFIELTDPAGSGLTFSKGFTNHGTIDLSSTAGKNVTLALWGTETLTNAADGVIHVGAGGGTTRTISGNLTNQGSLQLAENLDCSGTTFTNTVGMTNIAAGKVLRTGNAVIAGAAFSGSGTLRPYYGSPTVTLASNFTQSAAGVQLDLLASTLTINGPGTFINDVGNTLSIDGDTINAAFDNNGVLKVSYTSSINGQITTHGSTTISVTGDASNSATLNVGQGFTNNGAIELNNLSTNSATLTVNTGTLTNAAGATIRAIAGGGGSRYLNAQLNNQGLLSVETPLSMNQSSVQDVSGGTINVTGGNLSVTINGASPSFSVTGGTVSISTGFALTINNAEYTQTGGTTTVNGTLTGGATGVNIQAGTLGGSGVIGSNLTVAGTVSPGNSPGVLTVDGNYNQTGTLALDLNGTSTGTLYDQVKVNGTVTLSGSVSPTFGYYPKVGDTFLIIDNDLADVVTGAFSNAPPLGTFKVGPATLKANYTAGTGNDVTLTVIDTDATPHAAGMFNNVTTPGGTLYQLQVTYSDDGSIDVSTLDSKDVRVMGPNGFNVLAQFVSVDVNANGTPRVATYQFVPPGGTWNAPDDGTYSVSIEPNQVGDTDDGLFVTAGVVGQFNVAGLPPITPTAAGVFSDVTVPGGTVQQLKVTYTDDNAIDVSTLDNSDVRITGPSSFNVLAQFVSVDVNSNGTPRVATYQFTPPGGSWVFADNGTYTVSIEPNQVGDADDGLFVPAGSIGQFKANVPLLVTNANDNGAGSLRDAVTQANAHAGNDLITFDPVFFSVPRVITLTSGEIGISDAVNISGPGASLLTVNGNAIGRIFNTSPAPTGSAITISGLTIAGGKVTTHGAGIFVGDEALELDGCVVTGNTSTGDGGGIYLQSPTGSLLIQGCTISNNTVTAASNDGGGINVQSAATVSILNSNITGNNAADSGGGIYFYNGGSLVLVNSTLANNTATSGIGGGLYFYGTVGAAGLTIRNSTVSANTSGSSGGGIVLPGFNGTLVVQNCTITGNSAKAGSGGGIARTGGGGTISVESSIVSGNVNAATPDIFSGGTVNVNFSAVGSNTGFALTGGNNLPFGTDLKLGPLANNGGPTLTQALMANSPAIGKGSNPAGLTTDQRGRNRTFGAIDIGAFELQAAAKVASSPVIGDGTSQRSEVTQLRVTFDSPVFFTGAPSAAFTLTRQSDNAPVTLAVSMDPTNTIATVTFTGGAVNGKSLADGRYTLEVLASQFGADGFDGNGDGIAGDDYFLASALAPNPPTNIYRMFGDINGDGTVSASDFIQFRQYFGGVNAAFDFDGDGAVGASDFIQFRLRVGGSI
jgi:hypothetical protein